MLVKCRASVYDSYPTSNKHFASVVLCWEHSEPRSIDGNDILSAVSTSWIINVLIWRYSWLNPAGDRVVEYGGIAIV